MPWVKYFDQTRKITRIKVKVYKDELSIPQISFYSGTRELFTVGAEDGYVEYNGLGRVETFEIADDERLIGCHLKGTEDRFIGIRWVKMKIPKMMIKKI